MIRKCNSSNDFNYYGAYAKGGGQYVVEKDLPDGRIYDSGFLNTNFDNPGLGSWGLSTGLMVNQTGRYIFDQFVQGGALMNAVVVNKSTGTLYIGFNTNITGTSRSGTIPLEYNESVTQEGVIRNIWAIAGTGLQSIVVAQGKYQDFPYRGQ